MNDGPSLLLPTFLALGRALCSPACPVTGCIIPVLASPTNLEVGSRRSSGAASASTPGSSSLGRGAALGLAGRCRERGVGTGAGALARGRRREVDSRRPSRRGRRSGGEEGRVAEEVGEVGLVGHDLLAALTPRVRHRVRQRADLADPSSSSSRDERQQDSPPHKRRQRRGFCPPHRA